MPHAVAKQDMANAVVVVLVLVPVHSGFGLWGVGRGGGFVWPPITSPRGLARKPVRKPPVLPLGEGGTERTPPDSRDIPCITPPTPRWIGWKYDPFHG